MFHAYFTVTAAPTPAPCTKKDDPPELGMRVGCFLLNLVELQFFPCQQGLSLPAPPCSLQQVLLLLRQPWVPGALLHGGVAGEVQTPARRASGSLPDGEKQPAQRSSGDLRSDWARNPVLATTLLPDP